VNFLLPDILAFFALAAYNRYDKTAKAEMAQRQADQSAECLARLLARAQRPVAPERRG